MFHYSRLKKHCKGLSEMKKSTDELQKELSSIPNLTRFLTANQEQFVDESFVEMLTSLLERSGMSKSTLARRALTSEVYL